MNCINQELKLTIKLKDKEIKKIQLNHDKLENND